MKEYTNSIRRRDLIFYGAIACIGVIACAVAFSYPRSSSAFPRVLTVGILTIAIPSLLSVLRSKPAVVTEGSGAETGSGFNRTSLMIFVMTGIYIFALTTVGFFVSSYFFLAAVMFALKYRNKTVLLVWPFVLCGVIWLVFCAFLKVPTPHGFFF